MTTPASKRANDTVHEDVLGAPLVRAGEYIMVPSFFNSDQVPNTLRDDFHGGLVCKW